MRYTTVENNHLPYRIPGELMSTSNLKTLCLLLGIVCCFGMHTMSAQTVRIMPSVREAMAVTTNNTIFTLWDADKEKIEHLLRSTDGGLTFERLNDTLIFDAIRVMAVNNDVYLVLNNGSLYQSQDLGITWAKMPVPIGAETLLGGLSYHAQHGGGLIALYGNRSLWMYLPDSRSWSDQLSVPYVSRCTIRNGYDILIPIPGRVVHVLDPYTQSADTIMLPDFLGRFFAAEVTNGFIHVAAPDTIYVYEDGEMQILVQYDLGPKLQPKILHLTDRYTFTQDGWLERDKPQDLHTYSEAMGLSWPFVAEGVTVGGEWLYLHDRNSVYRINMNAPDKMEHVWSDREELDRFNNSFSRILLARNGDLISTNVPTNIGAVAAVSTDKGLSFHTRYADTCQYGGSDMALLPNGDIWMIAAEGCNHLSTNNGTSFEPLEKLPVEGNPLFLRVYNDGSVWITSWGQPYRHYRSTGYGDQIHPIPRLEGKMVTGSPWGEAFTFREYNNKVATTKDDGVTWDTVWHDPTKKSGAWNAGFEPFSETEMAIILNTNRLTTTDTSEVYLYDINTREVRLWATYRRPLLQMGRRPNGRLVAVMGDFSFVEYDEYDRPLLPVRDMLNSQRGHWAQYGFTLELSNDVVIFTQDFGRFMIRMDGTAVATGVAEPADMLRSSATVRLYPNPATDVVSIESSVPVDHYVVTDVMGRRVSRIPAHNNTWSASDEPSGVYYLSAMDSAGRIISTSALVIR